MVFYGDIAAFVGNGFDSIAYFEGVGDFLGVIVNGVKCFTGGFLVVAGYVISY